MDTARFSVFGVAALDLADKDAYRESLDQRQRRFVGEMPAI